MRAIQISIPGFRRRRMQLPHPGARPGTLAVARHLPPAKVRRVIYDSARIEASDVELSELEAALSAEPDQVIWLEVTGLGDEERIRQIARALELHPLTLEDIMHTHQRPKVEEFDHYLFATLRAVRVNADQTIDNEQISLVLKGNILVSFHERHSDGFAPVRRRLEEAKGSIRRRSAEYLFYALLDTTIDGYFPVLETYANSMDQLEEQIHAKPTPGSSALVHRMRRELRLFRRTVWPLREITATLGRNEIECISDNLRNAFRDCHDHVVQLTEFVEGNSERAADLGDLYQAIVSERTNQVMKTLTIVSTTFIPLTFLCGLYGMNFDPNASPFNMPELKWRYGYPLFWVVIAAAAVSMLWFFRRKGWIGEPLEIRAQDTPPISESAGGGQTSTATSPNQQ